MTAFEVGIGIKSKVSGAKIGTRKPNKHRSGARKFIESLQPPTITSLQPADEQAAEESTT
jgi:hypothetical protein